MKVAVLVELEAVAETTLGHFRNDILDSLELCLNLLVCGRKVAQRSQHLQSLILSTLEHQPTRTFRETWDECEDEQSQDDLKGNGKAPGDAAGLKEGKAKVKPVTQHDTKDNQ